MKMPLSTLALAVMAASALADTASDEPGGSGAYNLQAPDAQEYKTRGEEKARGELYGFAMIDMGYNGGSTNDNWFDVIRPTRLPGSDAQIEGDGFTAEGSTYASVRQSRLGVKGWFPTAAGEVHTIFEFELFGTGVDEGQTTFRLRHAYGEMGAFGAGQYWSPFMDINVFPNSVEYWGPTGMAFFRNVQFRWMPIRGDHSNLTFALERPGFGRDGEAEEVSDNVTSIDSAITRYPVPDLSAAYSFGGNWGYVRLAGILRYVEFEGDGDYNNNGIPARIMVDDDAIGWGLNFSMNINVGPGDSVLKFAVVGGEAIENYMNDGTGDLGLDSISCNGDGTSCTADFEPIRMLGTTLFYDLYWSDRWSSTIGFSTYDVDNRDLDNASNFQNARYGLVNLLYYPASNVMFGGELQYGKRENFDDGFDYDTWRIQFSARYNFSFGLGG